MIEEDKSEATTNYFGPVFTQQSPLNEETDLNKRSKNRLLIADFGRDGVLKALYIQKK